MTEYISSPVHMRDLIEGVAWTDVKAEISDMIENINSEWMTCRSRVELYRFQGRAEALKAVLMIPEIILEVLESENESEERHG